MPRLSFVAWLIDRHSGIVVGGERERERVQEVLVLDVDGVSSEMAPSFCVAIGVSV